MWSGTRSVGRSTIPSGKRPISSIRVRVRRILARRPARPHAATPPVAWLRGGRASRITPSQRVSRRGRASRRGPDGRRRPFPGDGDEPALRRALPARPAQTGQRRTRRTVAGRHNSRTANQDERNTYVSDLSDRIRDVIENEPVALFMKGTPQFIMCGNSDRALKALREAGAPVTTVDVLPDPAIRQELSAISGWPTIPQVFVKGELIGGADIVEELAASGELASVLEEKLGANYGESPEERTVSLLI